MSEAITLTIIGAIVGILLGVVAANPITKLLVNNSTTSTTTSVTAGPGGGGGGFRVGFGGGGPTQHFTSSGRGTFGGIHNDITNIHAAVGWSILIYGLLGAVVIAVLGSSVIAYFIAKIRPAEVMRTE
jgi:ABC-type antimicrobial peptide transport system permease subunit